MTKKKETKSAVKPTKEVKDTLTQAVQTQDIGVKWLLVKVTGEPFDELNIKTDMNALIDTETLKKVAKWL